MDGRDVRLIIPDREGRILLLRRAADTFGAGLYCLPGGKVDDKDPVTAGMFELMQETNLRIVSPEIVATIFDRNYKTTLLGGAWYGKLEVNEESADAVWVNPRDAREMAEHPLAFGQDRLVEIINDYL